MLFFIIFYATHRFITRQYKFNKLPKTAKDLNILENIIKIFVQMTQNRSGVFDTQILFLNTADKHFENIFTHNKKARTIF